MKKLHKWEIIVDDGQNVFKIHNVAENKKEAAKIAEGSGEVVRIKEIPDYLPSAARVRADLIRCGYGEAEADLVYRLLYQYVEGTDADYV